VRLQAKGQAGFAKGSIDNTMNYATNCIRTVEPHQGFAVFAACGSERARWGFAPKPDGSFSLLLLGGLRSLRAKAQFTQHLLVLIADLVPTNRVGVTICKVLLGREPFQIASSVVGAVSVLVMHMRRVVGPLAPTGCHDSVHEAPPSKLDVAIRTDGRCVGLEFAKNKPVSGCGKEMIEVSEHTTIDSGFRDVFHGFQVTGFGVRKYSMKEET
jgi:hypothetical protein